MLDRCCRPKNKDWHRYGGAGITVCERWRESFESFLADMGPRPPGKTLDRKRSAGNYERDNCRWATSVEQARNTGTYRLISAFGKTNSLAEWAREFGIGASTIRERLCRGWSIEDALSVPVLKKGREIYHAIGARRSMEFRRRALSASFVSPETTDA